MKAGLIRCKLGYYSGQIMAALAAVMLLAGTAAAEKRIGILMFSEEARYTDAAKAIRDRLGAAGFSAPGTTIVVENAEANKAKGAELVKKFAAAKFDLIFSLGTSITIPLARDIRDVPIVFSIVYDPVESGIARTWKSSGNNTTGTSTRLPMLLVLDRLAEVKQVKRITVLYTPGEKNSELQLADLQEANKTRKFTIIPVPLTSKEEADQVMSEVIRTSDALFLTGSNLVNSQVGLIVDNATRAKVVTVTHLEDLVEKGVLLGICASSYKLGSMAGDKGVKILKGAKPSSIPIETVDKLELIINQRTAKQGGFSLPPGIMKSASRIIP